MIKEIILLGSTGSIGQQSLLVCKMHNIKVNVLVANSNFRLLAEQIKEYKPKQAVLVSETNKEEFLGLVKGSKTEILFEENAVLQVIKENTGMVLNAIVGMAGLIPTLTAIEAKKDIALANKETLVCAGDLVMRKAKENNVKILPVDSEHSAIFQSIFGYSNKDIEKIFLTASGGPFFNKTKDYLKSVTVKDALNHPNWEMGKKITIDSATLMNKGLEVIEAVHLFNVAADNIEVVIHRESVLHSAVEYKDGSVIGQMGVPDMRVPIQYALTYPKRLSSSAKKLSFFDYEKLSFYPPDLETFTALRTCITAINDGGLSPCVVNSANEEAVRLFLDEKISFLEISKIVEQARADFLDKKEIKNYDITDVLNTDKEVRSYVLKNVEYN